MRVGFEVPPPCFSKFSFSPGLTEMTETTMRTETETSVSSGGVCASETIDATEAAQEFASRIKEAAARRNVTRRKDRYEVRPCLGVRGYTLKLPVIGWRLWFPSPQSAVKFAWRVAAAHQAECSIYDAAGRIASL